MEHVNAEKEGNDVPVMLVVVRTQPFGTTSSSNFLCSHALRAVFHATYPWNFPVFTPSKRVYVNPRCAHIRWAYCEAGSAPEKSGGQTLIPERARVTSASTASGGC
jgi:hypothetical protein